MKLLLQILGLLSCAFWMAQSATVTGSFKNADNSAYYGYVTFTTLTTPLYDSPDVVLGPSVRTLTDTNGAFTISLRVGNYRVNATNQVFSIAVPDTSSTYDITSLVTGGLNNYLIPVPGTAVSTAATASALGTVRTRTTQASPVTMTTNDFHHLNLKWYGAIGDGTTDDWLAWTNAFSDLQALGGGKLIVPKGHYIIDANYPSFSTSDNGKILYVPANTSIEFDGASIVQLKETNRLSDELVVSGDFSSSSGWTVGANWTISGGVATHTPGSTATISQDIGATSGFSIAYKIVATVNAGTVTVTVGDKSVTASATGTLWNYYKPTTGTACTVTPSSDFDGSIDSISLKKQRYYMMFRVPSTSTNVTIAGNGTLFLGQRFESGAPIDTGAVFSWGGGGSVNGITVSNAGTCLSISAANHKSAFTDCTFTHGENDTTSILQGSNISFDRCSFLSAWSTNLNNNAPQSGMDIEPESASNVTNIVFRQCTFSGNAKQGLYIQRGSGSTGDGRDITITDCTFANNGYSGLSVTRYDGLIVFDSTFKHNGQTSRNTDGNIVLSSLSNARLNNLYMTNNPTGSGGFNLWAVFTTNVTITSSRFLGSRNTGSGSLYLSSNSDMGLIGNTVGNSGYDGVYVSTANRLLFLGNTVYGSQRNGMIVGGRTRHAKIKNNTFAGNGVDSDATYYHINISGGTSDAQEHTTITGNSFVKGVDFWTGHAQAGGSDFIVLSTNASTTADYFNGYTVRTVSGTGSGQTKTVSDYTSAREAYVDTPWSVQPDATTIYEIQYPGNRPLHSVVNSSGAKYTVAANNEWSYGGSSASQWANAGQFATLLNNIKSTNAVDTYVFNFDGGGSGPVVYNDTTDAWAVGTVTVDRGGTGANLSDPGADRLIGWDNTDNAIKYITPGSGLTYNASTDTLSSTLYTDPGYDALYGWDNTDNVPNYMRLGRFLSLDTTLDTVNVTSGQSYNQATEPDISSGQFAFWRDSDDGKIYLIYDYSGTQYKIELAP